MFKTKLLCLGLVSLVSVSFSLAEGEPKDPVFEVSYSNSSPKTGDTIEIILTAAIPEGMHMYSTYNKCEIGPLKLDIRFNRDKSFELIGVPYSIGDKKSVDDIFMCELGMFDHQAEIRQKIKVLSNDVVMNGTVEGQWCTESTCFNFGSLVPLRFSSILKATGYMARPKSPGKPAAKNPGSKNIKQLNRDLGLKPQDSLDSSSICNSIPLPV